MDARHLVALLIGLMLAGWNIWQRLGRTPAARAWAHGVRPWFKPRSVLVVRPLLAAVALIGAASGPAAGSRAATITVGLLAMACAVLLLAFLVLPIPIPAFVEPRWYRESRRSGQTARRPRRRTPRDTTRGPAAGEPPS